MLKAHGTLQMPPRFEQEANQVFQTWKQDPFGIIY
jgi:hypothetical protein